MSTPPFGSRPCPSCAGSGDAQHGMEGPCGRCNGEGWLVPHQGPTTQENPGAVTTPPAIPATPADGLEEGRKLRDQGTRRAASAASMWTRRGQAYIESLQLGAVVTADGVTSDLGRPPQPNAIGALFRWASTQGYLVRVALVQGHRPARHAGTSWQWRRVDDTAKEAERE